MQSIMGISAFEHGTKQPIWAISTLVAIYLMNVLLPPMLGPVIICKFDFPLIISQSFEIH
jgi:hypothetical protein